MSTGADHYRDAEHLLAQGMHHHDEGSETQLAIFAAAMVHATLAHAAATALHTTARVLGDSPEVTDWARLIQPDTGPASSPYPPQWPPKPGDVWQDRDDQRWVCLGTGYLANLAGPGDDAAEEIWLTRGPLHRVYRVEPVAEVPF